MAPLVRNSGSRYTGLVALLHKNIQHNVTIGAGSVVTKDIPDNATAAGNYARVINYNNPARYIKNPWHFQ